jgi:hypothetical protein
VLWTPRSVGRPIRAGYHNDISVRVSHPDLPMIRPSVAVGWVSMPGQHNFHVHLSGALQGRVKVVYFEPEQDAVSVGLVIAVANRSMMVFNFEAVQLKHQLAV